MKFPPTSLALCLALIWLPVSRVAAVTRIYVAPQGNDANAASVERPLATPHAARDQARRIVARGLSEPIEIIFAAGLSRTLRMLPPFPGFSTTPRRPSA